MGWRTGSNLASWTGSWKATRTGWKKVTRKVSWKANYRPRTGRPKASWKDLRTARNSGLSMASWTGKRWNLDFGKASWMGSWKANWTGKLNWTANSKGWRLGMRMRCPWAQWCHRRY
jgi:hypothetical protein